MALDVWLLETGALPGRPGSTHIAALELNAEYVFLQRFWPASSSSGKKIDLYDDARYAGANLHQLRGCLERARAGLAGRPSSWLEIVGWHPKPARRAVRQEASRSALVKLLEELTAAVDKAIATNGEVLFDGD